MSDEKDLTPDEEIYKLIMEFYNRYQTDLLNELKSPDMVPNLLVAKIRDYNREWNKEFPDFPDAFIIILKNHIKDIPWPDDYKRALHYL